MKNESPGVPESDEAELERRAAAVATAPAPSTARPGLLERLTLRDALRAARAAIPQRDSAFRELRRRALVAHEMAERAYEPVDPPRSGPTTTMAAELYRQSAYWAMRALELPGATRDPSQLWRTVLEQHGSVLNFDEAERQRLSRLFAQDAFVDIAELPPQDIQNVARAARSLAAALIDLLNAPERRLDRLRLQRFLRLAALVVLIAVVVTLVAVLGERSRLNPNLAAGKPWRTSSVWANCQPGVGTCNGLNSKIFFHTKEDASPWIEYDLGGPVRFSRVFVRNRGDDAPDRALPLLIEVSDEGKSWREVSRRSQTFGTWMAKFSPVTARYVRLRVGKKSYLHLEEVRILP